MQRTNEVDLLYRQKKGIEKLQSNKVGALFMGAGTGKTRTTIELIRSIKDIDYILWLCPFRCIENENEEETTPYEVNKWGGFDVCCDFVGIESLSNSSRIFLNAQKKLEKAKKPFLVCDESLKVKSYNAIRTKRVIELSRIVEFKLLLNGTPLSKDMLDLWAQFDFLSPKILNMNIAEYKDTFCEYTIKQKKINGKWYSQEWISKYHNIDYLYSLVAPFVYECDLDTEIGKQYITISYTIEDNLKDEYYRIKNDYLDNEKLRWMNPNIFLELTQKMQHIYCNTEEKLSIVESLINQYGIENIIVFRKFIDSEAKLLERFPKLRVLSYQKNAHGLNCQKYNVMIEYDKTYNYAELLQARARILREGQEMTCYILSLNGNIGLEKMITDNIEKKQNILDYFRKKGAKVLQEL